MVRARDLLAQGADVGAVDRQGFTPLHFACQQSEEHAVRLLLDSGAPLEIQDQWGNTPLMRATMNSQGEGTVIRQLLAAGAAPDLVNFYGVSPRSLAEGIDNLDIRQFFRDA